MGKKFDNILCGSFRLGMLIPGKSHSRDESRNSQVSIETLDFARVCSFTCVIGVGSPAGGGHRPDPEPFPVNDGTPLPPADDQHSRQWRAHNGRGGTGGSRPGKRNGHRPPEQRAGESPPPPFGRRWTIGRRRRRDGRVTGVKRRAAAGSLAPWCTC